MVGLPPRVSSLPSADINPREAAAETELLSTCGLASQSCPFYAQEGKCPGQQWTDVSSYIHVRTTSCGRQNEATLALRRLQGKGPTPLVTFNG